MSTTTFQCGHPRSADNTAPYRGRTRCRACKRAKDHERHERRKADAPQQPRPRARPTIVDAPGDWVTRGACRDNRARLAPLFDPLEHGEAGTPEAAKKFATAVALCHVCPVAATCRSYAETHRLVGTWGGTYFGPGDHQTPQERAA